jgi:hypothetical protein
MNLDLWDNLVNIVFVNELFFVIILGALFAYYWVIYDINHWVAYLFASTLIAWLSIILLGKWAIIIILILVSFFLAVTIFRRIKN